MQGCATTVASVYAPNEAQASFFWRFFDTLDRYLSSHLVVGGNILGIFINYYQNLFYKPAVAADRASQTWFADLSLPTLSAQQLETLNAPCTKSLKSSTGPGPDGYTTTCYKKFSSTLTVN